MKKILLAVVATVSMVGCGPTVSAECTKYLACTEAILAGSSTSLKAAYGPGGTCWTTTTAVADTCTAACKAAVAAQAAGATAPAACK